MIHYIYETYLISEPSKNFLGSSFGELEDDILGDGKKLKKDIKKLGKENFKKRVVCVCADEKQSEELLKQLIGTWKPFYN